MIDRPGPTRTSSDRGADHDRRSAMVLSVTRVMVPVAAVFTLVGIWTASVPSTIAFVLAGCLAPIPVLLRRRGWSLVSCAWFHSALMLCLLMFISSQPDGTRIWSVAYCAVVPFIALSVAGARTAVAVAWLAGFVQFTMVTAAYFGPGAEPRLGYAFYPVELVDAWALTAIVVLVGLALERAKHGVLTRLEASNARLIAEVDDHRHTQERLEAARDELVRSARLAGMAEVANGVLHNVGNALNSVQTSAAMVRQGLTRTVERRALELAAGLIASRHDALVDAGEDRVARLGAYLRRVADQGGSARLQEELERLGRQVEHIAAIIAVQQENAGSRGLISRVEVASVVDEALLLVSAGLAQWGIEVVRTGSVGAPVSTDRHQVLQILTNLLSNARDELRTAEDGRRTIGIHLEDHGTAVTVEVRDSGSGIPAALRERIFRHGFTTKADGHGFGLHTSALAAKALGGGLEVGDSPLGGASFRLTLPRLPPRAPGPGDTRAPAPPG